MATEIFKRDLATLEKISEHLKNLGKTIKSGVDKPMRDFEKTTSRISKATDRITKSFDKLFGVVKRIGLASMLTGGALALRGAMAQKQSVEAKTLGVSNTQKGALEYAGKQTMADEDFFTNMIRSIKSASTSSSQYDAFGMLGLNKDVIRDMKDPIEALQKVVEALREKRQTLNKDRFTEAMSSVTGLSLEQFDAIDFDKFNKFFKEGLGYYDESNEKLKGVGESLNRVTANLQLFIDKTLASLASSFERVLNNISKGLNAIAKNPAFQDMLKKMEDWLLDISKGFDSKVSEMIKSIPDILSDMQMVFYRIVSSLANLSTWWQTGEDDERARKLAESYSRKADILELEKHKKSALSATTDKGFTDAWNAGREIEEKLGISKKDSAFYTDKMYQKAGQMATINITVTNDPTQAKTQTTYVESLSVGGSNGGR